MTTGLTKDFIVTKLIEAEQYLAELTNQEYIDLQNNADVNLVTKANIFWLYNITQALSFRVGRDIIDDITVKLYQEMERRVGVGTSTQISFDPFFVDPSSQYKIDINVDLTTYALDNTVVHLAGAETITGEKTFTISPIVANATLPTQAVNLSQLNATLLTADNGITINSNKIELGGTLIQNTTVSQLDKSLTFTWSGTGLNQFDFSKDLFEVGHTDNTNLQDYFILYPGSAQIYAADSNGGSTLNLGIDFATHTPEFSLGDTTGIGPTFKARAISTGRLPDLTHSTLALVKGIVISDSIDNIGLQYNTDFSTIGKTSDRWIPDWGAVKSYNSTNYVPYAGATTDVNLGGHNLTTTGSGIFNNYVQTRNFNIYDSSTNGTAAITYGPGGITGFRAQYLQDKNGTFAYLDDISSTVSGYLPLTGGTMTGDIILPNTVPTNALQAVNKSYIDNLITGLTWKYSVRVKTTGNITLSGLQTIDGISLVANDRILVANQTSAIDNGIYIVNSGTWTRSTDSDTGIEILKSTVMVVAGTLYANTQWTNTNITTPVIGTDAINYVQISGAGTYTNGTGITLSGNVFSLDTSYTRGLLSFAAGSGAYNNSTGVITIPTNNNQIANGAGYLTANQTITLTGDITGSGTTAITTTIGAGKVTNTMLAGGISASKLVGTDITTVGTITSGTWNGAAISDTYISSASVWNAKQNALTLTVTGNSGASTLVGSTLNIPTYTLAGLGGIGLTSLSATSPLLYNNTTGVFSIQQVNGSQNGYLSSIDWSTFNNKQAAGNYITALTGDGSASGPGSVIFTLATVNSNVGSFGSTSSVSTFTVNGKGLVTAAASTTIQIAESQVTNLTTDLATKQAQLSGTGFVKLSGTTVSYDNSTYLTGITGSQVTTALGYTPYNSSNPAGYISSYTETDPTVPAYAKSLTAFSVIKASTDALYQPLENQRLSTTNSSTFANVTATAFHGLADNSTLWNGFSNSFTSAISSGITSILVADGTSTIKTGSVSAVQTFLGLGSNAYTSTAYLPLTAGSGNVVSNTIYGIANSSTGIAFRFDATSYGGKQWGIGDGTTTNGTFSIRDITDSKDVLSIVGASGFVGIGYTADPTSGNRLGVNGNSYFNGTGLFNNTIYSVKSTGGTAYNMTNGVDQDFIINVTAPGAGTTKALLTTSSNNRLGLGVNNNSYLDITSGGISVTGTLQTSGTVIVANPVEMLRGVQSGTFISGYDTSNTTRTGYLQFNSSNNVVLAAENASSIQLKISTSTILNVANTGITVSGQGKFTDGTTKGTGSVADANILGVQSVFSTNSSSGFKLGMYSYAEQTVATTGSIQALEGQAFVSHTSGTVAAAIATIGNIQINGSGGTTTWARSVQGGGSINAGSVTNWARFYASAGSGSAGSNFSFYGEPGSGLAYFSDGFFMVGYTVSTLPAAGVTGRIAYVTDASSPTYLGSLTGGGSTKTPVFDNGSAWVSF